jgi:hypothetical protein
VASEAKLYVIRGSHACAAAELMLAHKELPFRRVSFPTGLHPGLVRIAGFSPRGARRTVDGRTLPMLAVIDTMGTVPALSLGSERVMGNHGIARLLEQVRPEPPFFPKDPAARARVEELERWGGEELQMTARRLGLGAGAAGRLVDAGAHGRLGPLLFRHDQVRRVAARVFSITFAVGGGDEAGLLGQASGMLDTIDEAVGAGELNGPELNAADFMIAPSVALLEYHVALAREIRERPVHALLERVLPGEHAPAS